MTGKAGQSGRRPQPTAIRVLNGNPGGRPLPEHEPKPKVMLPKPPAHLTADARREWQRIGKLLLDLGVMTEIDGTALAAYCQAYARWVEAEQMLAKHGTLWKLKTPKGGDYFSQSPYLAIANKAIEQMSRMLTEFGMTPSSRSRIHASKPVEADPFESFLSQRAN